MFFCPCKWPFQSVEIRLFLNRTCTSTNGDFTHAREAKWISMSLVGNGLCVSPNSWLSRKIPTYCLLLQRKSQELERDSPHDIPSCWTEMKLLCALHTSCLSYSHIICGGRPRIHGNWMLSHRLAKQSAGTGCQAAIFLLSSPFFQVVTAAQTTCRDKSVVVLSVFDPLTFLLETTTALRCLLALIGHFSMVRAGKEVTQIGLDYDSHYPWPPSVL